MKILKIEDMKGGWFVGGFEPTAYFTKDVEVCCRTHPKGQTWEPHFHTKVTEITLLVKGKMLIQNKELNSGDIFIIEPWEVANPVFLEDCEIVCVKFPSINDKKMVNLD